MKLDKTQLAQIKFSAYGLDSAATDNFLAAVIARLKNMIDSGTVKRIGRNHLRAAITAELAMGK